MKQYIGTKIISAIPMFKLIDDKSSEGYSVRYKDGYESWSPKDVFEKAYKESGDLSFGDAIYYLKLGKKVARSGWNGKNMWLQLVESDFYALLDSKIDGVKDGPEWNLDPFIVMKTAGDTLVPWLASQTDMLAEDWCII